MRLQGLVHTVKVGSILFTACGPLAIARMRSLRFQVMLDLKFYDIPSTVELSCRAAVRHRVSLITVHAAGSPAMLASAVSGAAAEARRMGTPRPLILGVTVLTSVKQGGSMPVTGQVLRLAAQALESGCDGVVASAQEARPLRRRFGRRVRIVCPGIRPREMAAGDQQRVCTPAQALAYGADALVIGRPITDAPNPRSAVERILKEMEGVNGC